MTRLALLAAAAALGCGTPPDTNACAGIVELPLARGARGPSGEWVVGGWRSDRVHYTALTTFRIRHGLGREPVSVECWASFTPDGAIAKQIGSTCQVLPRCGTMDGVRSDEVLVRNSGAQDFWARFVLR